MIKLQLISHGRLRTPGLRETMDHYLKLLSAWVNVEEIELKALEVPDKSDATRRRVQEKEAKALLEKIDRFPNPERSQLWLLDELGKALPTQGWADRARAWEQEGPHPLVLVIGSSLGFAPVLRSKARGLLSLGPQTLPHELARVVLCEQLYRGWSVVKGHPYHHEGS